VANALRLLNLGEEERQMVREGVLSAGHAKVLLGVSPERRRMQWARRTVKEELSVRQLENLLKKPRDVPRGTVRTKSAELMDLEDDLQRRLGTKVTVSYKKGVGKIAIEYYSDEELERLLELFRTV